jgi:D-glycero-alpha-D-manno-heptose-7-phosphate kinase
MIITQTPLRVSFFGGGTDLPSYYQKAPGAVLSTAIDKYIYVTVKRQTALAQNRLRISYSKTENVDEISKIEHPIVREALLHLGIERHLEINVIADVPAKTGLGSSGAFTVGLLNTLHALKAERATPEGLAAEATAIEAEKLGRAIGKQDQYAAAFGGLNAMEFFPDGAVKVERVRVSDATRGRLFSSLMLFYTGLTHDAHAILSQQAKNADKKRGALDRMRGMVADGRRILESGKGLDEFGFLLGEAWKLKASLSPEISNSTISDYYSRAVEAGALGGKLLGAGGGGFLLFYARPSEQPAVRRALAGLYEMPFAYEPAGSRVIFQKE